MTNVMPVLKGNLDMLVLKALSWGEMHGFEILEWLEQRSGGRLDIDDSAISRTGATTLSSCLASCADHAIRPKDARAGSAAPIMRRRFRRLFRHPPLRRDQLDRELDDEIRSHIAARAEQLERFGMTPEEARAEALGRFRRSRNGSSTAR
jgi:hypothetical protein